MEFRSSAEVHQPASASLSTVRKAVELHLNAAFALSSLAAFDCQLWYVPIVMPASMRERYLARSRLRRKARIYACCPQLSYETFVNGELPDQLREYLRGLESSASALAKLGAAPEQVRDFEGILAQAVDHILLHRPDQTRH